MEYQNFFFNAKISFLNDNNHNDIQDHSPSFEDFICKDSPKNDYIKNNNMNNNNMSNNKKFRKTISLDSNMINLYASNNNNQITRCNISKINNINITRKNGICLFKIN